MFDKVFQASAQHNAPEVLYHYTSWSGLRGILKSQRFWATAHDCTNDEGELKSADEVIMEVAVNLRKTTKGTASAVLDLFLDGYPKLQITHLTSVYLSCFSVARDLEEQWRRYGDDGHGVCMGIKVLAEMGPQERRRGSAIIKVEYSETTWRANLSDELQKLCRVLQRLPGTADVLESGLFEFYRVAAFTSMGAKRQNWAVEQEYRRVTILHKDANVAPCEHISNGKTRRYLPTAVRAGGKKIALSEIIVGPNQDFDRVAQRVSELLTSAGYVADEMEYPKVARSAVAPWVLSSIPESDK
jgi:hypothetical protein